MAIGWMRHEMKSQAVKFMTSTLAGVLSLLNLPLNKIVVEMRTEAIEN